MCWCNAGAVESDAELAADANAEDWNWRDFASVLVLSVPTATPICLETTVGPRWQHGLQVEQRARGHLVKEYQGRCGIVVPHPSDSEP
jgi:hypothetical protein